MTIAEARQILNVSVGAGEDELKNAYRAMAMQYHPDKNSSEDSKSKFIEIHEAYEILTEKAKAKNEKNSRSASYNGSAKDRTQYQWGKQYDYNRRAETYTQEEWDLKYQNAQDAFNDAFEKKSQIIYQNFFNDYKAGWKRKFVIAIAIVTTFLAIIFSVDYALPKDKYITKGEVKFGLEYDEVFVIFDGLSIRISMHEYHKISGNYYIVTYYKSRIFKDYSKVILQTENNEIKLDITPINPISKFSIFILILLFPLMSFLIERPNFNFVFFVIHINIYIIPIIDFWIMSNSSRYIKLWDWIFSL